LFASLGVAFRFRPDRSRYRGQEYAPIDARDLLSNRLPGCCDEHVDHFCFTRTELTVQCRTVIPPRGPRMGAREKLWQSAA
jgi:hypothetical protein